MTIVIRYYTTYTVEFSCSQYLKICYVLHILQLIHIITIYIAAPPSQCLVVTSQDLILRLEATNQILQCSFDFGLL
jgi:hypothetical protein